MTMTALAVVGPRQLDVLDQPIPRPEPDEILVRVAYCGICGSDVPRYLDGAVHTTPQVLGHEFSGVVAQTGVDVTSVRPGDRIAVAPLVPCHRCAECAQGRPALCPRYSFVGSRRQGALAQYVCVPAVNAVPVEDLPLRIAALIEPLTVALHAIRRARPCEGRHVAVLGAGVIGIMSVIALRDAGATDITVVDRNPWVLEVARRFGATRTLDLRAEGICADVVAPGPPSLTIETAGAAATRDLSLQVTGKNGEVVYVGTPRCDLTLSPASFEQILRKELTLHGSWMSNSAPFPGSEWHDARRVLARAAHDPATLVTHEYSLAHASDGFAAMRGREPDRVKVMIVVGGDLDR